MIGFPTSGLIAHHSYYFPQVAGPRKHGCSRWNFVPISSTSWDPRGVTIPPWESASRNHVGIWWVKGRLILTLWLLVSLVLENWNWTVCRLCLALASIFVTWHSTRLLACSVLRSPQRYPLFHALTGYDTVSSFSSRGKNMDRLSSCNITHSLLQLSLDPNSVSQSLNGLLS